MKSRRALLYRPVAAVLAAQLFFSGLTPSVVLADGAPTTVAVMVSNGYDGNGNLVTRTDGNGYVTTFAYDAVNRLIAIDYPGGSSPDVSFTYDVNGNRTSMTDATGTTEYGYDRFDRLTEIDYPNGNFVAYGYDNVGNVTDLQYGNWAVLNASGKYTYVRYTYDEDNRLASVRNVATGHTTTYTYDAAGNVSRRNLPNSVTTDYRFDADGRLTNVLHRTGGGALICQYGYTLNAIGNRTQMTETTTNSVSVRTTAYTYDALDRLETVLYPEGRFVSYGYDSFGNRLSMTEVIGAATNMTAYSYDTDSRLLSTTLNGVPDENFYYDATGNLVQRVRPSNNRVINYGYDYANRLTRYYDGTNNVEYVYNGVGQRVAKIVNGQRIAFLNDPHRRYVQVLAETDVNGVAQRVYEWGKELINQEDIDGSNRYLYLQDSIHGSVRRLVDAVASVVNCYEYDAFGKPESASEGTANDYQFQGETQEAETGLVFLRARHLDPVLGRFLQRDSYAGTLQTPQTVNPYPYVRNDPINLRDPLGTEDLTEDKLVLLAKLGAKALPDPGVGQVLGGIGIVDNMSSLSGSVNEFGHGEGGAWGYLVIAHDAAKLTTSVVGTVGGALKSPYGLLGLGGSALDIQTKEWGNSLGAMLDQRANSSFYSDSFPNVSIDNATGTQVRRFDFAPNVPPGGGGGGGGTTTDFLMGGSPLSVSSGKPGGVKLDKTAKVLLDINNITGATYDPNTGQIIIYGTTNSPTALPPMNIDDLAVAFRAVSQGSMPVVSIENPKVNCPPPWGGRECWTVRYGQFYTDPLDGQSKVLDVSSKTHFGWVMFEADRLMKCLQLGKDNRTSLPVSSSVPGYRSYLDLMFDEPNRPNDWSVRFWLNPKEIAVEPSADGKSMELRKAEMQVSTEVMYASSGELESFPADEYTAKWMTDNYDDIANEQVTYDNEGKPHFSWKELKQLAYLVGIVKWVKDNNIPFDSSFLKDYVPTNFPSASAYTPNLTVQETRGGRTLSVMGGVNYCFDLDLYAGTNATGSAAAALRNRPGDSALAWSFTERGTNYNVAAVSADRKEKAGGFSQAAVDASLLVQGALPLVLARYFDSFNVMPTPFGYG